MLDRLVFIASIILLLLPFIGIYSEWKIWIAFSLGAMFFLFVIIKAIRNKNNE